ncbi:hypothetical protein FS749_013945 [Ceratobasidium sp. UAMH 11750]|nr:hypothetical protein FS749_013945 [Ceratobasidium sp. UAMH 11750]
MVLSSSATLHPAVHPDSSSSRPPSLRACVRPTRPPVFQLGHTPHLPTTDGCASRQRVMYRRTCGTRVLGDTLPVPLSDWTARAATPPLIMRTSHPVTRVPAWGHRHIRPLPARVVHPNGHPSSAGDAV